MGRCWKIRLMNGRPPSWISAKTTTQNARRREKNEVTSLSRSSDSAAFCGCSGKWERSDATHLGGAFDVKSEERRRLVLAAACSVLSNGWIRKLSSGRSV